jgi:hypothetical protein
MRPYHIPLAVRIIILYRLFLLFCVYYGYSFPSTALLSVTHLSRPQLDPYFPPPLHIPLSCPRIFLCLASGASSPCLVLSFLPSPPSLPVFSLPRSVSSASSASLDEAHCTNASLPSSPRFRPSTFHPPPLFYSTSPCLSPTRSWVLLKPGGAPPCHVTNSPIFNSTTSLSTVTTPLEMSTPPPTSSHTTFRTRTPCWHPWLQRQSFYTHRTYWSLTPLVPFSVVSTGCISVAQLSSLTNRVFLTLERPTAPADCVATFDSDGTPGLSGMREK